jgi:hypothetical protein
MKGRALADLVIVVPEAFWGTVQQRFQSGLALDQRQSGQVLAIEVQYIEKKKTSDPCLVSVAFWIRLKAVRPSGSTPMLRRDRAGFRLACVQYVIFGS